jgi:hypothetical protein
MILFNHAIFLGEKMSEVKDLIKKITETKERAKVGETYTEGFVDGYNSAINDILNSEKSLVVSKLIENIRFDERVVMCEEFVRQLEKIETKNAASNRPEVTLELMKRRVSKI